MTARWLNMFVTCLLAAGVFRLPAADDSISFNHQVRPLLSDRCFTCHGPDEKARKGKMRLDTVEGSRKALDDGWQVVKPGAPEKSEVVRRIFATDPDEIMPPPESHLVLSPEEKSLLKRWIEQGGEYEGHWSFMPVPAALPVPKSGFTNPIDAFVATRLQQSGLKLSPRAAPETLIRRLSFDLTGLPPALGEVARLVSDPSPDSWSRLADELLASPRYGERMATDWLDLARYADTYGYQADVDRDMFPWRDWVIKAFNENLPYDDFITWQIAGDLLPNATREQILATAFNRLHRQTNEGGSIEEEFRVEYVSDRVHTFGTAMLGLTFECSRCHDHKYDPIKQRDYYSLSAFFNNIDESGLYSHFTRATPNPTMLLYQDAEQEEQHRALKRRIVDLEKQSSGRLRTAKLAPWILDPIVTPAPQTAAGGGGKAVLPKAAFAFDLLAGARSPDAFSTNAAEFVEGPALVPGKTGQAVKFSGDNEVVCKHTGHFGRTDAFSISLWLKRTEEQDRAIVLHHSRAWTDSGSRGYELVLDHGKPFFGLIHFWPGNAIAIQGQQALPLNEWVHVTLTYDGSSHASGLGIYLDGQRAETAVVRDHLFRDILHRGPWGDGEVGNVHLTLGGRFRDSGFRNGLIDDLKVYDRDLSNVASETSEALPPANAELAALRRQENELAGSIAEIMVMQEMAQRRPTYLLKRGAYDARADEVQPDAPAGIMPFDPALPRNRLGLAEWLTDRRNPLVARVAVNRIWKQHFGRGIVATVEDFGAQGRLPTHPELLDWLAAWLMAHNWDVKALHKLIVSSANYQQTSHASDELLARDPHNDLLARGPKLRLTAEQLRDQALAVSALLNNSIGGASVKPYQPAGLWEDSGTGKTYHQDQGDKLYRRSLYTFWRRTAPPPAMTAFDATSREVCTARREVTATPLQSLVLLNDPQFVEAARVLAETAWRQHQDDLNSSLEFIFKTLTSRAPDQAEREILNRLFKATRSTYAQEVAAAESLLATGETPIAPDAPKIEIAALTTVASMLMNYDEFVMKR